MEVHVKFKLLPETLYLTVNLVDRFLARRVVSRSRLQLVGVTAMLLASKREEQVRRRPLVSSLSSASSSASAERAACDGPSIRT